MPRAKAKKTWRPIDERIAHATDYLNRTRARVNKLLARCEVLQSRLDTLAAKKQAIPQEVA